MGLPKRPKVVVRTPPALFVGEQAALEVIVETEVELSIDFVLVKIYGMQGWCRGDADGAFGQGSRYPNLEKQVAGKTTLPPGSHSFTVRCTLPAGTAPTHDVRPAVARLFVDVHVSIPWWPDGRYRFKVPVRLPPAAQVQRTPVSVRVPYEVAGDEPRIEVALASSTLVAGETLLGSVAVYHLPDDQPREVDVSFEPQLVMRSAIRNHVMWGDGYRTTLTLPAGSAGTTVPIRIALPAVMTPSFHAVSHDLQWHVKVKIGSLFTTKIEGLIPLTILDVRAAGSLPPLTIVPRLADERVLALFDRFVQGPRGAGSRLVPDEQDAYPGEQPSVVAASAGGELRVGYAYKGTDGTYLVARATYPSLGLDLSVRPSSTLRELLSSDLEVGVEEWDRIHRVDAREAAQAVPFLRHVVEPPRIGDLVRWTDDEIVFERKVVNVTVEDIARMMAGLEQVAGTIAAGRSLIAPPAALAVDLDAWRSLADRLGAPLCVGDLSIDGALDATRVVAGLVFDDTRRPTAMRAFVGDPKRASERAREARLALARPSSGAATLDQTSEQTSRTSSLLASWPEDIIELELADGVAAASLPVAGAGTDAARVRELIRHLQALLASLDESTGPYR